MLKELDSFICNIPIGVSQISEDINGTIHEDNMVDNLICLIIRLRSRVRNCCVNAGREKVKWRER